MAFIETITKFPVTPYAALHLRILPENRARALSDIERPREFAIEAFKNIQAIATDTPNGLRIIMQVGKNGGQNPWIPLAIDVLGGEILRTSIKKLYDPKAELKPSEVNLKSDAECVFDKIIRDEIPVKPLLNEEGVFVFVPSQPLAKRHLLFLPTIHWRDIPRVTDPNFFGAVFAKILDFAKEEEFKDGFILESNNGPWAGQVVPHLHFHMLGGEKLESPFWQDWV